MKVLVACEESQEVCKAFRERGHDAYSADLQDCSGGHPEWHIKGDVLEYLNPWFYEYNGKHFRGIVPFVTGDLTLHQIDEWDLIIAHPPCTYITAAGACRMYPTKGQIDEKRLQLALDAKMFFMLIRNAECKKICIENPKPLRVVGLPRASQRIQPYEFGEPWSKLTYLWLKGLPPLMATEIVPDHKPYVSCGTSRNKGNPEKSGHSRAGGAQKVGSKTFPGIARAMAEQWG